MRRPHCVAPRKVAGAFHAPTRRQSWQSLINSREESIGAAASGKRASGQERRRTSESQRTSTEREKSRAQQLTGFHFPVQFGVNSSARAATIRLSERPPFPSPSLRPTFHLLVRNLRQKRSTIHGRRERVRGANEERAKTASAAGKNSARIPRIDAVKGARVSLHLLHGHCPPPAGARPLLSRTGRRPGQCPVGRRRSSAPGVPLFRSSAVTAAELDSSGPTPLDPPSIIHRVCVQIQSRCDARNAPLKSRPRAALYFRARLFIMEKAREARNGVD